MPSFLKLRTRQNRRASWDRLLNRPELPLGAPVVFLSGGSPVDLDASLFVQLGIFVVAFFMLRALVFKPVMKLFDARVEAMEGSKQEAAAMEQDAVAKREAFEGELRAVRQ